MSLPHDLRYALRNLRHSPGFTAVAVTSLALGIGANTAIFSLLDQALLRLLPVRDPQRLFVLHREQQLPGSGSTDNHEAIFSRPMYLDLAARVHDFEGLAARMSASVDFAFSGQPQSAVAEMVSGNFFEVLGVSPALGRVLMPEDDGAPGARPVIVLSHDFWMRHAGGNPAVLNQSVRINGHPMIVVGVAARGFRGVIPGRECDLFVPIAMKQQITPTWNGLDDRNWRWLSLFARLRPGISPRQAEAELRAVYEPLTRDELSRNNLPAGQMDRLMRDHIRLLPAGQGINDIGRRWQTPLTVLMGMVGLVLVIACANLASIMLARAAARRRELAIRMALGASRAALARYPLVESVITALAGGLLALPVAWASVRLLTGSIPSLSDNTWLSTSLDARILAFNMAVAMLTGILFGIMPALQAMRADVAPALRDQTANATAARGHGLFRRAMVVAQVCLSMALLTGAGLFARSLINLTRQDPGFHPDSLLAFRIRPELSGYDAQRALTFYRELQRRLSAVPGVTMAAAASSGPFMGSIRRSSFELQGIPQPEGEGSAVILDTITSGYLRTLGIPLMAGREFDDRETETGPKAAIVNQAFVRRFCGGANPIGRLVGIDNKPDREIVGVAGDNRFQSVREQAQPFIYLSYAQEELSGMRFFVRTSGTAERMGGAVRAVVAQMDRSVTVTGIRSMRAQIDNTLYADRLIAILSIAFGVLAAFLAATGLYGVIAWNVARRTSEIGIRVALGASRGHVLGLVLRETAILMMAGLLVGVPLTLALGGLVQSQLYGLEAHDPAMLIGAAALLWLVALIAAWAPARTALAIEPARALRTE